MTLIEELRHFAPDSAKEALMRRAAARIEELEVAAQRSCTCHPSEAPVPCRHKHALSECVAAAAEVAQ